MKRSEIEPFTHRVNYRHRAIGMARKMEGNKFIRHEDWGNPKFGGLSFYTRAGIIKGVHWRIF